MKPIKSIIDDYDLMSCGLTNNIKDFAEAIYVVRGFEGDDLSKLAQNLRTKKVMGAPVDGGLEVHTIEIPREARLAKLELDEKNIYRFGMGLNTAQVGDGNVTNVVIKSRYALLDLKCNKLEGELKALMRKLVKVAVEEINTIRGTAYGVSDAHISFKREVMTNASDNAQIALIDAQTAQTKVATLLNAAATYGDEAMIDAVCDVLGLDPEAVRSAAPAAADGGMTGAVGALAEGSTPRG